MMPGTYSQILLHVVFSTKQRRPWLTTDISERLHEYIGGIVRTGKGTLYAIGGADDHLHLYLRWRTDEAISDLVRDIKAKSSSWMHANLPKKRAFAWQTGYAVFSVSKSQEKTVKAYIARQREHHRKLDFKTELSALHPWLQSAAPPGQWTVDIPRA